MEGDPLPTAAVFVLTVWYERPGARTFGIYHR
ncbi:Uncharacterised protein [Vibrio cholerae]|nr:Uncharacterised protein [Vibrio cholerae]